MGGGVGRLRNYLGSEAAAWPRERIRQGLLMTSAGAGNAAVSVDLGVRPEGTVDSFAVYGCDLIDQYVRINVDYTT